MHRITIALIILVSTADSSEVEGPCQTDAPILTSEQAMCVANQFFYVQSCASTGAVSITAEEKENYWVVRAKHKSESEDSCPDIAVTVCKNDGRWTPGESASACDR